MLTDEFKLNGITYYIFGLVGYDGKVTLETELSDGYFCREYNYMDIDECLKMFKTELAYEINPIRLNND